ncbi:hypothetical protein KBF61_01410, partial [Candidatus Saccharibacteria bacterium]|nr:hypothetical protein [Candidatus Saccharibacteria bacterium]
MDSLDDIKNKVADAITQLDIADREARLSKLETEALEPDFWNDSDSAQVKSKAIAKLKSQIEPWRKIETRVS